MTKGEVKAFQKITRTELGRYKLVLCPVNKRNEIFAIVFGDTHLECMENAVAIIRGKRLIENMPDQSTALDKYEILAKIKKERNE